MSNNNTTPAGKPNRHQDCSDCSWSERVEEYWSRHLKAVQQETEAVRRQAVSLFENVAVKNQVVSDELEKLSIRVDEGFRSMAEDRQQSELELRRWLETRLGRIESTNELQDKRIRDVGGRAGSAGARTTATVVSAVVLGLGMGIAQLVQWLQ